MKWFNSYTYKRDNDERFRLGSAASSAHNRTYVVTGKGWTRALPPTFRNVRKRFNASNYPGESVYNEMTGSHLPAPGEKAPPVSLYHRVPPFGARVRRRRFK